MTRRMLKILLVVLLVSGCAKEYEYKCCKVTDKSISCVEYSCSNPHEYHLDNTEDIKSHCEYCPTVEKEYQHWKSINQ